MSTVPRRMKAIRDYVAQTPDELSFKEGAIIYVPVDNGQSMLKGVLNGKVGSFPRVMVDDTTADIKAPGKVTRVKAIQPYEAQNEDQLSFPRGVVMFIAARVDANWWKGVYKGKAGLIPATHVMDASATETLKRKQGKKIGAALNAETPPEEMTTEKEEAILAEDTPKIEALRCKAIKSHVGEEHGQLSFKIGEIVFVPKPDDDEETWSGVCRGVIGSFPKSFVMDTKANKESDIDAKIKENEKLDTEKAAGRKVDEERERLQQKLEADTAGVAVESKSSKDESGGDDAGAGADEAAAAASAEDGPAPEEKKKRGLFGKKK